MSSGRFGLRVSNAGRFYSWPYYLVFEPVSERSVSHHDEGHSENNQS